MKLKEKIEQLSNRNFVRFCPQIEKTKSRDVVMKFQKQNQIYYLVDQPARQNFKRLITNQIDQKSFQIINCANLDNDSFEKSYLGLKNSEIIKGA